MEKRFCALYRVTNDDLKFLETNPEKFWCGVKKIENGAFFGCTGVTSITIPDGVTEIGDGAFKGCTGLTSITIPDTVAEIGYEAFSDCIGLTSITIPDSVTTIEAYSFWGCTGLTSVTIPDSVTEIGNSAFLGCTDLTTITIPSSVTEIGEGAFSGCRGLTSITIPNSVTKIKNDTFHGCTALTSITIPNSVTKIGGNAFSGYTGLTSITIPSSVTEIGESAFQGCTDLTSITIPNSVTKIGECAFSGCRGLTSITIPNSVTEMGNHVFEGCTGLTSITIPSDVTEIEYFAFSGCSGLTSITIPSSVTEIGDYAFRGCTGLTSITIPDSVTKIGDSAFFGCIGLTEIKVDAGNKNYSSEDGVLYNKDKTTLLYCIEGKTSITISSSVTEIEAFAFFGCTGLTSITIPNSVTEIGNRAFSGCTGLTSITIPSNVTKIGGSAFYGCTGLCLNFKNLDNIKNLSNVFSGTEIKYVYFNANGEAIFSHKKEPQYENYTKIVLTDGIVSNIRKNEEGYFEVRLEDFMSSNFRKNLAQVSEWKKQGEVKFIPPKYTLDVFPADQLDKYFVNKNNKRWGKLVERLGFSVLSGQEKYNSLTDLMKIYYALGGFSENQGESEKAFEYVLKHVAISHDEYDSSPQAVGAEIHRRFSGLTLHGPYNPDFAKFFMRYYHKNPDFMFFDIDDGNERDYLCQAHNHFGVIQRLFPNMVVNGNTQRDLLSPKFVAEHCNIEEYEDVDEGNEALALMVGRYGYSQEQFDQIQEIYNEAKGLEDKYVIQADRAKAKDGISFRVLEKDDPLGFVLGYITDCCQYYGNPSGGDCVDDGYRNPEAGFLVFEEEIKDENGQPTGEHRILAQAYVWYDPETKTVCYDNIEIPDKILRELRSGSRQGEKISTEALMNSVVESADAIMSAMNRKGVKVERVTTGRTYNDLASELEERFGKPESPPIAKHRGYSGYTDADRAQYLIRTYDQTTKCYVAAIKDEIAKAQNDIGEISLAIASRTEKV